MENPSPDQIDALARQARTRPPDKRAAFLREACPTPDVREAVEARLEALHADATLDPDAKATQAADAVGDETVTRVGAMPDRIGPWRLQSQIGRGSMGTVYLAERDDGEFRQRAALKLIRHDLGRDAQERFRAERQILAELQHPNIAHLLDGGVTEDGRPYFAMEYVDGTPLVTYCNERGLGVPARLRLFQQVCDAVAFAHRNLIVHRDLKPSNILVTESGTSTGPGPDPQVKLLDFGIAKALEGAEAGAALTRTGEQPMTPLYAAPEQVEGDAITTATDVYTLGVVLHELLTGRLPYDVRWKSVAAVAQVIASATPTPPSERVPSDPEEQAVADTFGTAPEALRQALTGDLDVITQKALRKEPERRYPSAAEVGQDVERHLNDRPVEARSATTGYRLRRFVARHRGAVFGSVAAVALLMVGLGVAIWQAQVAAAERDRARAAQAEAEQAITFLSALFENATPEEARGDTLTAYDLVDRGRRRLSSLSDQPALQARMFDVVGGVYNELSDYQTADSLLRRAVSIQRSLSPPRHQQRLGEFLSERAGVQMQLGHYATADSLVQAALQHMRAAEATVTPEYAETLSLKANIALNQQHLDRADSLFERTEARYETLRARATPGSEEATAHDKALAGVRHNRASIHFYRNNFDKAESLYRTALRQYRRLEGPTHPDVITMHSALGLSLRHQGAFDAAAAHLDTAITRGTQVLGPRHAQMATYYNNLADVRRAQGRYAVADSLYRRTLAIDTTHRGPQHPYVADDWESIALVNRDWGRLQHALRAFEQETALRRLRGPSTALARALLSQGQLLTKLERYTAAEQRLQDAHSVHAQVSPPDSALAHQVHTALATLYAEQNRPQKARRWRERAAPSDSAAPGPSSP